MGQSRMTTFEIKEPFASQVNGMEKVVTTTSLMMMSSLTEKGLGASEAGSIIAHVLMRAAWICAASGRLEDGHEPKPEKFAEAAKFHAESITFENEE